MPLEVEKHPLAKHAQLVPAETVRAGDLVDVDVDGRFEPVTYTRFSPVVLKHQIQVSNSRWVAREHGEKVLVIRRWHLPGDWHED